MVDIFIAVEEGCKYQGSKVCGKGKSIHWQKNW